MNFKKLNRKMFFGNPFACYILTLLSTSAVATFEVNPDDDDHQLVHIECSQNQYTNHTNQLFEETTILKNSTARCSYEDSKKLNVTCIDGIEYQWLHKIHHLVGVLTIVSWPEDCLSPTMIFHHFPHVETLAIINSTFSTFTEDFPSNARSLRRLYLNGLSKLTLRTNLLSNLPDLEELDLRANSLKTIHPDFISSPSTLKTVLLLNNRWNCSHREFQWLAYLNTTSQTVAKSRISDYNQLTCQGNIYPGKPVYVVMNMIKMLDDECPKECTCILSNLVRNPGDPEGVFIPVATADCRNRGLLTIPMNLPSITTILLLQGNNISELRPFAQNTAYRNITDVYLDNNLLSSVRSLEGADWMLNFHLLSLRGNNLSYLPIYVFEHALRHNINVMRLYLGNNPWKCNCHFTPKFQEFLLKYKRLMADLEDIRCRKMDQSEISKAQISTLSRSVICRQVEETLSAVDIVNIFLTSLILLVVGKFGYDYYYFKKTGRLPWISSKIP